jgi:hypothetical protein
MNTNPGGKMIIVVKNNVIYVKKAQSSKNRFSMLSVI